MEQQIIYINIIYSNDFEIYLYKFWYFFMSYIHSLLKIFVDEYNA